MASSFASIAVSKASIVWCTSVSSMKISVLAAQIMTSLSAPDDALNLRMSSRIASASSRLFLPCFTFVPWSRFT